MRIFENQVQQIKNEVYQKVAQYAFEGILDEKTKEIPYEINPGPNPRFRCCIHHERAVTSERLLMAFGGDESNDNLVEVLPSACDQCLENRYVVTEICRGCLAHRCKQSCPKDAITIVNNKAFIDQSKCIECGRCHASCPYDAVADVMRPCVKACPTGAIQMDEHKKAIIDNEKCIQCGTCVYYCPFGAIQDKSQIVEVIEALKQKNRKVYGIIAPAIATQYNYVDLGKVITAMKILGFTDVVEVALGADVVAIHEAEELIHRLSEGDTFMTSSCCPAFVNYVHEKFPELVGHISTTISPMVATARLVKSIDPEAVVVFIGPCIAKKEEEHRQLEDQSVDYVLVFEELTAMIETMDLNIEDLKPSPLNNASAYGRGFATSGGVTAAVNEILKNKELDMTIEPLVCDGIEACDKALRLGKAGRLKYTFIEGMACRGGCIKGPVTMHYGPQDTKALVSYCNEAIETASVNAVRIFNLQNIQMER
ncbi:4Fe-4S dicluster domain-containing protein [Petrocella sp. FN5]|uniref:4Fe-4S dicluster domain-containing protein n=1 Tax=Petrocella sp. FN5 TaxID=3032002 RepID=UPI0023DBB6A4|nr:4Fe-4S dicluster domain-containing protein [Petrocella sp. FN5]MDF1617898.1 4Fe-4S dicluster domain-containing protein [Petrocella sp. FN5]